MMDGTIWAESEYGKGSTFIFNAWFGIGSATTPKKRFIPDVAGLRALVVDDNEQAREILTENLRLFALRAESVSSGEDAIRELVAADCDRSLWPGVDGLAHARHGRPAGQPDHQARRPSATYPGNCHGHRLRT